MPQQDRQKESRQRVVVLNDPAEQRQHSTILAGAAAAHLQQQQPLPAFSPSIAFDSGVIVHPVRQPSEAFSHNLCAHSNIPVAA